MTHGGNRTLLFLACAFASAILLAGCKPRSATVELRSGFDSTRNMKPVETRLYVYVDDQREAQRTFAVKDEVPLVFRFPAAYYALDSNLNGGAQARIDLDVDTVSFKPSAILTQSSALRRSRRLHVTIHSNIFGKDSAVSPDMTTFPDEPRLLDFKGSTDLGKVANFRVRSYDIKLYQNVEANKSQKFGPFDLYQSNYYMYPDAYGSELVKIVDCDKLGPACKATLFYKGRTVDIFLLKEYMAELSRNLEQDCRVD